MKTSFALEFTDAAECADFFIALGNAFRSVSGGAKRAVSAAMENMQPVAGMPSEADESTDGDGPATADAPATGEPGKRKRRTKAEMEAAKAAETASPSGGQPASPAVGEKLPDDYLLSEMRETGNAIVNAINSAAVVEILTKHGIKRYPDLPPAKRPALLADLKAALATA